MKIIDAHALLQSDTANTNEWDGLRNGDGVAGNIHVTLAVTGADHIFCNVQPGEVIPAKVTRVYVSDTTVVRVEGLKLEY